MNDFFARYNDDRFTYNPRDQPELEFIRLRDARGWSDTGKAGKRVRREFLVALVRETKSPVHAYFVEKHPTFNYDSRASPKLEFQRLAMVRGWKETKRPYKRARSFFEEAFDQEFNSDLDNFFKTFPNFDYNPRNEPKAELRRLTKGWDRNGDVYEEARDDFFTAFVNEFESHFGTDEDDIESWESLCRALGVDLEPIPPSVTQCKRVSISRTNFHNPVARTLRSVIG